MRNWKIIKWDTRPKVTTKIEYHCIHCSKDANLAVSGLVIAQIGQGLVFDKSPNSMPDVIECPNCRKRLEASDVR